MVFDNNYFSEKRLEKIRPKNECDEDVGSLSLPNCIKVTVTNLNFVTIFYFVTNKII